MNNFTAWVAQFDLSTALILVIGLCSAVLLTWFVVWLAERIPFSDLLEDKGLPRDQDGIDNQVKTVRKYRADDVRLTGRSRGAK